MRDYWDTYRDFSIRQFAEEVLSGDLDKGINGAVECCDRWAEGDRVALNWIGKDFAEETITFAQLKQQSARFANYLKSRGIGKGDVVGCLLPRIPELLVVALGTWRAGAIYQPLFTAFGPTAIASRVTAPGGSHARIIVADQPNATKLNDVLNCPPVIIVERGTAGAGSFWAELQVQPPDFAPVMLRGDDPFVILFTSGTTGSPKGVRWPLRGLLSIAVYTSYGIDLRDEDRFWNVADPGWAYGMAYAVVGPLLLGHSTTFFEGGFAVDSTVRVITSQRINSLAAAPTAYRMLMAAGDGAMAPIANQLRIACSCGEPLNPEVIRWADRVLHVPLCDQYGQTEALMVVCNFHGLRHQMRSGTAGLPMPGLSIDVLDDQLQPVPPDTPGILAVHRPTSPLLPFDGYWAAETPSFKGDWYLTGDTVRRDEGGNIFFVGRNDDVITSAGYRIGPFDVESSIIEHPAVAEVAVIGKPDPDRTEIVKAFVVLRPGVNASELLKTELQHHVRNRLALHAYPREIEFINELPKTPSGKIQRFLLRRR
jgi:acetyl-CoA synthetase